jgi:hypothetical protein
MTASILPFPTKADTERNALVTQARANYDAIFPAETTTSVLGALGPVQSATLTVADLPNVFGQVSQEFVDSLNFMPASAAIAICAQERNRERIDAIRRRDNFKFCASDGVRDICDDLRMDHVDTGIPCDVAYCAPDSDPA